MSVYHKKIKAFTLSEMLVVLVISGIVISITMLVLRFVNQQINAINGNYEQAAEVRLLERVLRQDFNTYNLGYDATKQLLYGTSAMDTVVYTFNTNGVIRNADTLKVPIMATTVFLEGTVVQEKNVDAIELQVSNISKDQNLFIYKMKDATYYMNRDGI